MRLQINSFVFVGINGYLLFQQSKFNTESSRHPELFSSNCRGSFTQSSFVVKETGFCQKTQMTLNYILDEVAFIPQKKMTRNR